MDLRTTEEPQSPPVGPAAEEPRPVVGVKPGPLRWVLFAVGVLTALIGALGAVLPVLPTTPFLLLAAACFARSSPAFQRRLLANRVFGPYIAQWQRDRTVPRAAKRKAYAVAILSFGVSIWMVDSTGLRVLLACLGLTLLAFLRWLPTTPEEEQPPALL